MHMKPFFFILMLLSYLASAAQSPIPTYGAEPVKIGVIDFPTKAQALARWQSLTVVLKQAMPERDFVVLALSYSELDQVVAARQLDFVLTNAEHYVLLRNRNGLSSPLATLDSDGTGQSLTVFGGVIFGRAGQADINSLSDIRGKSVAAVTESQGAAYQMRAYELSRVGIRLPQDVNLITGLLHDQIVETVLAGHADVGFVRSGVLEGMVREGKLDTKKLKIINRQDFPDFPFQVSTRLYPEWPFAAMPHIDENLARHVVAVLFELDENKAATRAMGIHGFVVPADYSSVEQVLRELRMPPFDVAPPFTLQDVWTRYRWQLMVSLLASGVILLLGISVLLIYRKLVVKQSLLLQQQQNIQEHEEFRSRVFDSSVLPIVVMDAVTFQFVDCNSAAVYIYSFPSREEVLGKTPLDVSAPVQYDGTPSAEKARFYIEKALAGEVVVFEWLHQRPDGELWDAEVQLMRFHVGQCQFLQFTLQDISESKRAQEKILNLASFPKLHPSPVIELDSAGKVSYLNPAAERLFPELSALGPSHPLLHCSGEQIEALRQGKEHAEAVNEVEIGEATYELHISYIQDVNLIRIYVMDITKRKRDEEKIYHLATTDSLTGIANRREFTAILMREMDQAKRYGSPMVLAMYDLDYFKRVNDTFGHDVGDHVLQAVTRLVKQNIRSSDIVARWGGEEFMVLMPQSDIVSARNTAEKLRLAIAGHHFDMVNKLTVSFGVTAFEPQDDLKSLLKRVDEALYQAKKQGRNRVEILTAEVASH
ncbi:MAG: diguanylate cyclase [Proteobacteria bacterium]|nr:diguanylate cyclase [Pseudomonadota bacterium]MBU1647948.1 diguanylate cyclase [Pseudomonadota bacterium]